MSYQRYDKKAKKMMDSTNRIMVNRFGRLNAAHFESSNEFIHPSFVLSGLNYVTRQDFRPTKIFGTTDFLARHSRNRKKLNNRDTNYTNFHELLSGHEERLTQIRQNVNT
jgi:hypothetical protein